METEFCHDCGKELFEGEPVAPYSAEINGDTVEYFKCEDCFDKDPILRNYQPCEVYTRVVGYLRPVSNMNEAKRREVEDRKMFQVGENST